MNETGAYDDAMLPAGIRARMVAGVNGLDMHVLEAGDPARPCVLLLHGFPELAFSWRKVMPALAAAGYYAVAPDQRGYGRTTGWASGYDDDLTPFRLLNMVRDALALLSRLGLHSTAAVVGHDFGSSVAAYCALIRPDIFRATALMSAPFAGPPAPPFAGAPEPPLDPIHDALAALDRPRKHYHHYNATRPAAGDWDNCAQGVRAFLRAYYHHKSVMH